MQTLEEIVAGGSQTLAALFKAAYDIGYAKGRDDVRKELDAFLKPGATFATRVSRENTPTVATAAADIASDERAAPGTVKPGVLQAVRNAESGLTTEEIVALTRFKYNSVRGTLWALQGENQVERRNHLWFAIGTFELKNGQTVTRERSGQSDSLLA